jgi:hypothetical protein
VPSDYVIKTDDTRPEFAIVLTDQDGVMDLSATTAVRLILKKTGTTVTGTCSTITITAAIAAGLAIDIDPDTGDAWTAPELATECVVRYPWIAADTSSAGVYQGEVELTYGVGLIETVPNDGYFSVEFVEDLD